MLTAAEGHEPESDADLSNRRLAPTEDCCGDCGVCGAAPSVTTLAPTVSPPSGAPSLDGPHRELGHFEHPNRPVPNDGIGGGNLGTSSSRPGTMCRSAAHINEFRNVKWTIPLL